MRVALFPTCLVDAVAPQVGLSVVRVLRRMGHEVVLTGRATCCGQPAWNAGQAGAAAEVARTTLAAFEDVQADVILIPAGSCATMIRVFWPEMFEVAGDHDAARRARAVGKRVREFSEFLAAEGPPKRTHDVQTEAVYHHSCHMLRELGIREQPESVLEATGATRVTSESEERCCGFGGLFSVKLPEVSTAMGDEILDAAVRAGAAEIVGCDPSCLMHLQGRAERRRLPLEFRHLAQIVDEASS